MPMKWRFAWVLALAMVSAPAFALGLGQIQVRSQYGEPFLAEIPIVSSDPSELRQLQARLASPDTFSRIGLPPPEGLILDLQFNVALDGAGRPVIRVTGSVPVDQPILAFLIEADWGQGRLVREYSALLDAPDAVSAPGQPPIHAPLPDTGDRIVRVQVPLQTEVAGEEGTVSAAAAGLEPPPSAQAGTAPTPGPAAPVAARGTGASTGTPLESYGPVQAGDTLSQIVQRLPRDGDLSANQMMLALLRANPAAFIGGNINLLREGAILRMPGREDIQQLSAAEASAQVQIQVARWREMSGPRTQPVAGTGDPGNRAAAESPLPAADARLEIAPPAPVDGQHAGVRSGITAGGEGETLRQELQETRETLAARDAEVEELRARLAELEEIQDRQQQLISLKDSELAAVQQRLADPGGPATSLSATTPDEAGLAGTGALWPWIGLGAVWLIAAAIAWMRLRRGRVSTGAVPGFMAAVPGASEARGGRPSPTWHAGSGGPGPEAAEHPLADAAKPEAAVAGEEVVPVPEAGPAQPAQTPGADSGAGPERAAHGDPAGLSGAAERVELAKAYVELGDVETARGLLQEVADGGAGPESDEAVRLLRGLA